MGDREKRLEEILAEWDLDEETKSQDTYSIDLSGVYSNVSLSSPYTISSSINFPNAVYTTTATASPWATYNPNTVSSKISLDGKDADIEINGVSLWKTMQEISNRLNIMQTNPELEVEWRELRELGEKYRQLEQHILDKQATFDRIRAMPAPNID